MVMKECVNENKNENEIRMYPAHYYYLELNTAKMLHDLDIDCDMPEEMMERRLEKWSGQKRSSWILCSIGR